MQNNAEKLQYLRNQENNIALIFSAVFNAVNRKKYKYASTHGIYKEKDLPEVYLAWMERFNSWKEEFRPKLYKDYSNHSAGMNHNMYLLSLFMGLNGENFQDKDDPIYQELCGIKLEGELCIPDEDEL